MSSVIVVRRCRCWFAGVGAAGGERDDEHPAAQREDRPDGGGPTQREAKDQGKDGH